MPRAAATFDDGGMAFAMGDGHGVAVWWSVLARWRRLLLLSLTCLLRRYAVSKSRGDREPDLPLRLPS